MKNGDDKIRTLRVRLSGLLAVFFLIASIVTLILTFSSATLDEEGKQVFSPALLNINMLCFFAFLLCLIFFIVFFVYRLRKRTTGKAMEMKPKETFQDNKKEGEFLENITVKEIPHLVYSLYSYPRHLVDFITLGIVILLSLLGGILVYFQSQSQSLAYALFSLAGVSLFIVIVLLLLPLFQNKKPNAKTIQDIEIYQDKMVYVSQDKAKEVIYYSSFVKARENKSGFCFIFYVNGEKVIYLNKAELKEDTCQFLSLKTKQIKNYNLQGIA